LFPSKVPSLLKSRRENIYSLYKASTLIESKRKEASKHAWEIEHTNDRTYG
jgi:hypothetical protein